MTVEQIVKEEVEAIHDLIKKHYPKANLSVTEPVYFNEDINYLIMFDDFAGRIPSQGWQLSIRKVIKEAILADYERIMSDKTTAASHIALLIRKQWLEEELALTFKNIEETTN